MTSTRKPTPVTNVVIYVRISKWRDNETSTETQRQECIRYAKSKGWVIPDGFILMDEGKSAYKKTNRPGLTRAMELVESGQAQAFIVWKLSRFMRSATEFVKAYERIQNAGAEFVSVTENFDTSTALGRLGLNIMASLAEMESEIKSDNAKTWHEYRRAVKVDGEEAALPTGGVTPYGYTKTKVDDNGKKTTVKNTLLIDELAAKTVTAMFAMAVETRGNLTAIAKAFAEVEGAPKEQAGIRWMLRNPVYVGKRHNVDHTELVKGCWEAIIDEEVYEEVVELLADPNRKTNDRGTGYNHLLAGFVHCGKCGTRMVSKYYRKRPRYLCRACNNVVVEALADDEVERDLLARFDRKAWQALRLSGRTATPQAQEQLANDIAKVKRLYDSKTISLDEWVEMRQEINANFEQAASRKSVKLPDVDDLRKAWPSFTLKQKRMVIGAALEKVSIKGSEGKTVRGAARVDLEYIA